MARWDLKQIKEKNHNGDSILTNGMMALFNNNTQKLSLAHSKFNKKNVFLMFMLEKFV